jgi:hypothetical protein
LGLTFSPLVPRGASKKKKIMLSFFIHPSTKSFGDGVEGYKSFDPSTLRRGPRDLAQDRLQLRTGFSSGQAPLRTNGEGSTNFFLFSITSFVEHLLNAERRIKTGGGKIFKEKIIMMQT